MACIAKWTLLATLGIASPAFTEITIDQNKAMAGGVTAGDAPGFPVTLSWPGNYRLTGNLRVGHAWQNAIEVTASDVTIDLNGHRIRGPVVCTGTGANVVCNIPDAQARGVLATGSAVTVINGHISGMGMGIELRAETGPDRVESVTVRHSANYGIRLSGIVKGCTAEQNGGDGITLRGGMAIGNVSSGNAGNGILLRYGGIRQGGVVLNNTVSRNGEFGLFFYDGAPWGFGGNALIFNAAGAHNDNYAQEIGLNAYH